MNAALRWNAPDLDKVLVGRAREEHLAREQASEREQARQLGFSEGFDKGMAEGRATGELAGFAAGEQEARRMTTAIATILDRFQQPLRRLDADVLDALTALCTQVCTTLLGREYAQDPQALLPVIQGAIEAAADQQPLELRLHPDDVGLLSPFLPTDDATRITADPELTRGDLRLHAAAVRIDATVAGRVQTCIQSMLDQQAQADAH